MLRLLDLFRPFMATAAAIRKAGSAIGRAAKALNRAANPPQNHFMQAFYSRFLNWKRPARPRRANFYLRTMRLATALRMERLKRERYRRAGLGLHAEGLRDYHRATKPVAVRPAFEGGK